MQTFLPYPSFLESAQCLDNKRLGKQRVEAKQILEVNLVVDCRDNKNCDISSLPNSIASKYWGVDLARISWENHPAVLMWRGYEKPLALYGLVICSEWRERGFKDSLYPFFSCFLFPNDHIVETGIDYPPSVFGLDIFYSRHEDYIRSLGYPNWYLNRELLYNICMSHQSNLVRKDPDHYRRFFPEVEDNLPYFWPVRRNK